jgi:hypothetical protein
MDNYLSLCFAKPTEGVWHHWVIIYDSTLAPTSTNGIRLFIDSIQQNPVETVMNTYQTGNFSTLTWYLMSRGGTTAFTAGQLDDFKIYNYALTDQQIKLLYNNNSAVQF